MIMLDNTSQEYFDVSPQLKNWMREIRRYIHAHPELSFNEKNTAAFIQSKLHEIGIGSEGGIAATGVVARLPGNAVNGPVVALRADMDALPITEETGLSFSSIYPGIMHACGHDGHVAMLLGGAALLAQRDLPGEVRFIFQPAEEHGNGAQHIIDAGVLDGVGAIFAGHVDTHYPVGVITIDEGIVCAWADPFCISLQGRSGHAARPHEAVDTVVAAANLILSLQTLVSRGVDPNRSAVVTIGSIEAGTAQNIIAQEAVLMGTVRSTHNQTREKTLEGLNRVVDSIGQMHGVDTQLNFHDVIPAVNNDKLAVESGRVAAAKVRGISATKSQGAPSLGAEDFAFYQQIVPGCIVRFGAALQNGAGVSHSRTFDFNEDVLAIGASWYAAVAYQWLQEKYSAKES